MRSEITRFALVVSAGALLLGAAGCSISPDEDSPVVAYEEAESVRSLEVPPDLTRPSSDGGVEVPGAGGGGGTISGTLLPQFEGVRFVRAGVNTWLEIDTADPGSVWPRVDAFLRSQGLTVARREPSLGVIETGWAVRQDAPGRGGIGGFFDGLLGGITRDNIQDKYTMRLERMEGGAGTRIFVTHHAAQEVDTSPGGRLAAEFDWARLAGNPAIEAEMSRRLLVYLGMSERRAEGVVGDSAASLGVMPRYVVDGGAAAVMIDDTNRRRVFARVGDGLGDLGAEVLEACPGEGRYVLEWVPPEEVADTGGFLGLFGGGEPDPVKLQLQLRPTGGSVRIKAADAQGVLRSGEVHRALLRRLAVALGADPVAVQGAEEADAADEADSRGPANPAQ